MLYNKGMEWRPFSHIRHGQKGSPVPFFILLALAFISPLFYYMYADDGSFSLSTTTLDFENKQVLASPIDLVPNDTFSFKILRFVTLAYEKASKDTVGLLALASPNTTYVRVVPGLRKEQIAEIFGSKLKWTEREKNAFENHPVTMADKGPANLEGYYHPGDYILLSGTDGEAAAAMMFNQFSKKVESQYGNSTAKIINLNTALKVASLIEREAAGKSDMRLISGIIWNRIFAGMNLQIDATLQYAKGTENNGWWPPIVPNDKYLDSPYNTYQNAGFPPSPISNPSVAAIAAALNPQKTKCMFYIHDNNKKIHCAANYEDHERNIRKYLY